MSDPIRLSNWYSRLASYIDAVQAVPFAYGQFDCTLFASGAVEAMTGVNLHKDFIGKYKTKSAGLRKLKAMGIDDHIAFAATLFVEIHPSIAQVGDIAVVEAGGGYGLGVVQGSRVYVTQPDAKGLGVVDLLQAVRAFRVPSTEEEGITYVNQNSPS